MTNQPKEPFDKEAIYDEQVAPLVTQIIKICQANDIPLVFSACYSWNEEEGFGLCSTLLPAKEWQVESFDEIGRILMRRPFMMAVTMVRGER